MVIVFVRGPSDDPKELGSTRKDTMESRLGFVSNWDGFGISFLLCVATVLHEASMFKNSWKDSNYNDFFWKLLENDWTFLQTLCKS